MSDNESDNVEETGENEESPINDANEAQVSTPPPNEGEGEVEVPEVRIDGDLMESEVGNSCSSGSEQPEEDRSSDDSGKSDEFDRNESADDCISDGTSNSSSGSDTTRKERKSKEKKSNRCHVCRKKVGLTGFVCRCGGLFCSLHRYSDKHGCSFNYREQGAAEIRKNNPEIVAQKITKI